ncbi:conjugative transposon protein TraK [Niabella beijingensis]|uniref:conjugative transposon protein TraK n=1 Tax=Niabella beijingensis TaxID=2872700 RepID=UPI001CBAB20F|nr:conjugative transposon protein TraK [Niabella beijingensis]MBZ4188902.1 conjugative transposon protein TraK [Niabella beijingensis]
MIKQLKNIDTAFKHIRLFTAVLILASTLFAGFCFYYCIKKVSEAQSSIYVIANGKALQATASSRKNNLAVEARDHIRTFHDCFFSFSPDDKAIEESIRRALYLADESAKQQYDALKEKGFYASIVSGNISQQVIYDSISLNLDQYPYHFRFYGKQQVIRSSATITRNLITEGYLRELNQRSDNNPHAFLIEKWFTIDNNILSTTRR